MECIGKRYLIQGELPKAETKNGIYIPVFGTNRDYGSYMGTVIGWGTGWTEEEKKDLVPVGSKIILNYMEKTNKVKVLMGEKNYYICQPDDILAIVTEEE